MPISLTVAEKLNVIENRCKALLAAQLQNELLAGSIENTPDEARSDEDRQALGDARRMINQQGAQIAYLQAQYEALEDVAVDEAQTEPVTPLRRSRPRAR